MKFLPYLIVALACLVLPSCAKKNLEKTTQAQPIKPIDPTERARVAEAEKEAAKPLPNGMMPHQPDPSDPNYAELKAQWIRDYPEEYNGLQNQQTAPPSVQPSETNPNTPTAVGIIEVLRSNYNAATPEKRAYIDAHPELYRIIED